MNEPIADRMALWDEFLSRWPIENLKAMTLAEYSRVGDKDCFTYWLEARTEGLGSIWGGSAFKFGVYARKDRSPKQSERGVTYGSDYAWAVKYGATQDEAFATVLALVIQVAQAAQRRDLKAIESINLGPVTKWKIAFLYQDRARAQIVNIFQIDHLRVALGSTQKLPASELHFRLEAERGSRHLLEYGDLLWNKIQAVEAALLTTKDAQQFLQESDRFDAIKPPTERMAGFRMREGGRELALALDNKVPTLYLSAGPWMATAGAALSSIVEYPPEKTRTSGIQANATTLAKGNAIVKVTVSTLAAMVQLCAAYEDAEPDSERLSETSMPAANDTIALNQIFYGPPGTGKTYRCIHEALRIADPSFLRAHSQDRVAQKARFDELVEIQRVRFVTFHQSFSYEDFVEGIRPVPDEDGQLRYEPVDGLFKLICNAAQVQVTRQADAPPNLEGRTIWKMSLGNTQLDESDIYDECMNNGYALLGYGGSIDFTGCQSAKDVLQRYKVAGNTDLTVSDFAVGSVATFMLKMKVGDLIVVTDGNYKFRAIGQVTGPYEYAPRQDPSEGFSQKRRVQWFREYTPSLPYDRILKKQFVQRTIYELHSGTLDREKLSSLLAEKTEGLNTNNSVSDTQGDISAASCVLIIDEINRGNVSRIFGELITLLEESKRKGQPEALEVVLPYSKERFSIPKNVYLIGTMNTTDRSLTGLDIALRRRFSFVELPPLPELLDDVVIEDIGIGDLLRAINERVEVLLDRDHCIGHAYFLPLKTNRSLDLLASIFRRQILPLLQEYFFEDWSRIRLVLNDHRKADSNHRFVVEQMRTVDAIFGTGADVPAVNKRWVLNEGAFKFAASYAGIAGDVA